MTEGGESLSRLYRMGLLKMQTMTSKSLAWAVVHHTAYVGQKADVQMRHDFRTAIFTRKVAEC